MKPDGLIKSKESSPRGYVFIIKVLKISKIVYITFSFTMYDQAVSILASLGVVNPLWA